MYSLIYLGVKKTRLRSLTKVMLNAMNQVVIDGRSVCRVALNLDLPYVSKIRQDAFRGSSYFLFSHRLVSNKNEENKLAEYLKIYSGMFNGLPPKPTNTLAYELALQNETNVPPPGVRKGR